MGFFDPNTIPQRPNLEPPGFDLLRAMMMQRTGDTFSNPYGLNPQFLQGGGFGPGGGGGQIGLLQALLGMNRPQFDPYSAGMPGAGMPSPPTGPNSAPMGGGGGRRPRTKAMYDGTEAEYDGMPRDFMGGGQPNRVGRQQMMGPGRGFPPMGMIRPGMGQAMAPPPGGLMQTRPMPFPPMQQPGGPSQAMAPPPGGLQMSLPPGMFGGMQQPWFGHGGSRPVPPGMGGPPGLGGMQTQPGIRADEHGQFRPTMPGRPGMPGMMPQYDGNPMYDGIPLAALMAAFGG